MGATVLHEDSIFPLRQEGIPIHVLNTNAPQDPGTMIVENTCSKPKFTITGIAGKKGFASILSLIHILPSLVLTDKKLLTLPLSTYSFYGTYSADYGTIMAGLLLCVIPILILYVALQKQIINGVVAGAVK